MTKTISQTNLSTMQARGAKINRKSETPDVDKKPTSIEPAQLTPVPEPTPITPKLDPSVQQDIAATNRNMQKLADAMETIVVSNNRTDKPVAYDLVIKRDRQGLMDRVRVRPVTGVTLENE